MGQLFEGRFRIEDSGPVLPGDEIDFRFFGLRSSAGSAAAADGGSGPGTIRSRINRLTVAGFHSEGTRAGSGGGEFMREHRWNPPSRPAVQDEFADLRPMSGKGSH